VKTSSIFTST